ncbi:G2/mitotic-specific cyclin-B2 [Trichinella pseudospiralis]|uniref:G2/mitotic-specific cyclin-B2 n=1 Tax=Trichinella pseudospiralis TaxID=6337 RepID=A0A0V1EPE5_TRIPS|nr:G2/mitotic-specific cyclin-B2 [Trichinella pseudospiralis]KRZ23996.1 G2/mitotic-specific cyclin-B2 [Trichinella pseudospiralis]KRZ37274.1 G2/mitotic-specific cyclin-B2 [Trichinella pseudospiralis]
MENIQSFENEDMPVDESSKPSAIGRNAGTRRVLGQDFPSQEISEETEITPPNETDLNNLITDIDAEDHGDPNFVADYVNDIYQHLFQLEKKMTIRQNYMARYRHINHRMRCILVDWMFQVVERYDATSEAMFMSVSLLDMYLQKKEVTRDKLQLVGCAALLCATKFEDLCSLDVDNLSRCTDYSYSTEEIFAMERELLCTLNFEITRPHSILFLRRFAKASEQCTLLEYTIAKYFLDVAVLDYYALHFNPSMIAAASLYLALLLRGQTQPWATDMQFYSTYTVRQLYPCAKQLLSSMIRVQGDAENKSLHVSKKYDTEENGMLTTGEWSLEVDYLISVYESLLQESESE